MMPSAWASLEFSSCLRLEVDYSFEGAVDVERHRFMFAGNLLPLPSRWVSVKTSFSGSTISNELPRLVVLFSSVGSKSDVPSAARAGVDFGKGASISTSRSTLMRIGLRCASQLRVTRPVSSRTRMCFETAREFAEEGTGRIST